MTVTLPWPPRELSPNARTHWAAKAYSVRRYRQHCAWLATAAGLRKVDAKALTVAITFCPPDKRHRDLDNLVANLKAGLDGIADVIGVDDSRWRLQIERAEPVRHGAVRVEIKA